MSNTELWDVLSKTDPDQTKTFTRGGGFKGTAVKPIYTELKMTERFGPCGTGWGINKPEYQIVAGDNKEVLVYCTVSIWYMKSNGDRCEPFYGVGGDKVVSYVKPNEQYKRPERWENDDEAFKKAFTDAVGNAMKHLGMSADVHMGRFDDSKYVQSVREEIADKAKGPEDRPPKQVCDDFLDLVRGITDRDEYVDAWNAEKSALKKIQRTDPLVYNQFIKDLTALIAPKGFNETKEDSGAVPGNNPPPAADPQGTDKGSDGDKQRAIAARCLKYTDDLIDGFTDKSLGDVARLLMEHGMKDIDGAAWVLTEKSKLDFLRINAPDQFRRLQATYTKITEKDIAA